MGSALGGQVQEVIRVGDQVYLLATSALADDRTRVLKHGATFAVLDRYGDIEPIGLGHGLYHCETRFLSRWVLRVGAGRPLLLNSTINEANGCLSADLSNLDISVDGEVIVPRSTLHMFRRKFLWDGVCYECLRILNYSSRPLTVSFSFEFEADFADIFEVRGMKRERQGQRLPDQAGGEGVVLAYRGLDGVARRTRVGFSVRPEHISPREARFTLALKPRKETMLFATVTCELDSARQQPLPYAEACAKLDAVLAATKLQACRVRTSSPLFDDWLTRSEADLQMMTTGNPEGPYPYAGVPWYSTVFGRDGIITALQTLWMAPGMAKAVLEYLAATQATESLPEQDADPGKILHEKRIGEMAVLNEVPFGRYYGSADATPLFVVLAGAYHRRTGDLETIQSIWPNIEAALNWMATHGDPDQDGFVEYARQAKKGLLQQGWKDSHDSVFHADGSVAEPPIALCEVQGYVYAARRAAAGLAAALGHAQEAEALGRQAEELQQKFEQAFWCDDLGSYALALDAHKRPCRVRASNAGHCLYSGIASRQHAERTARTLLGSQLFSGWGVRTVGAREARYNPMSYHNGSVWPHDNALIARGLARYGLTQQALKILNGLFEASLHFDLHRLPELFCGFRRRAGDGPTHYPVACAPQSWASASVYLLLQACLGLSIDALGAQVRFSHPLLPQNLDEIHIHNLRIGPGAVNLVARRRGDGVSIEVLRREGQIEVTVLK